MKSYSQLNALYGTLTKNTAAANLTLGDQLINDEYRMLCALKDFQFLHRTRTITTSAATQFKALPYDMESVESVYVTLGSTRYTPKILRSREQWDILNLTQYNSDIPTYAFVYNGQLGLWPVPLSAGTVITLNGKIRVTDLSVADTTAQTVSITTATSALAGSGTSWHTGMTGFWTKIALNITNDATTGDAVWYEISGVSSTTAATLVRLYGGTTVAAGTAVISQMPLLPEAFQPMPVWKAAADYWFKEGDMKRATGFMANYDDNKKTLKTQAVQVTDVVLDQGDDVELINPNLTITM